MDDLSTELTELAKRHFPETVAGELKTFIDQANQRKRDLDGAKRLIVTHENALALQKQEVDSLKVKEKADSDLREKDGRLNKREFELDARERKFEIELLEADVKHVEASKREVFSLVRLIFSHPNVTVCTDRQENKPVAADGGGNGCSGYVGQYDHKTSETVRTTEGKADPAV